MRNYLLSLLILFPALYGCKASYSVGSVKETISRICSQEYGVEVEVAEKGTTIGALIAMPNLLNNDLTISEKALKKIEHVMLTTSHVTLSSEFKYEFFVIDILDTTNGVQVSFIHYIKDIRRLIMDDISRGDYFQRMLIDVDKFKGWEKGKQIPAYTPKEYKLPDFLAAQIAKRIKSQFNINLIIGRIFKMVGIEGQYIKNSNIFRLTIYISNLVNSLEEVASPEVRENFTKVLFRIVRKITKRYEFNMFEGLEIVDGQGKRLAYFDKKTFTRDTMGNLLEIINSIQKKAH